MNRDTERARWYRRVDPSCFTASRPAESRPAVDRDLQAVNEHSTDRWTPVFTATVDAEAWRPRFDGRPRRVLDPAIERAY